MQFTGNIVALVTPFRNGQIDHDALTGIINRAIAGGVSGLVPCGTTGESPTLSHDEHDAVNARAAEAADGRLPVIAGTGSNSTQEAVRLGKAAEAAGANALLSVNPYYNKPSQDGLYRHFTEIANATSLPVVLYNIPGRTSVELEIDTIARLAEHPNIQAIKEATGNLENVTRIRTCTDLAILSGDDALTLPTLALGGSGVISVISNLLPGHMTRLVEAALSGDIEAARAEHDRLYPLMKALFIDTNPVPIKEAMALAGWIEPELRLPLCRTSEEKRAEIENAMIPFQGDLTA